MLSGKRRFVRKIVFGIDVEGRSGEVTLCGSVKDLSPGGMCLKTTEKLPVGCVVEFNMRLYPQYPSIKCIHGNIRWKERDCCYGLEFDDLSPEVLELIDAYCS